MAPLVDKFVLLVSTVLPFLPVAPISLPMVPLTIKSVQMVPMLPTNGTIGEPRTHVILCSDLSVENALYVRGKAAR